MNRKNLLLLIAVLIIVIAVVVAYYEVRAEPVEAISAGWAGSGHADQMSESFVHWDEDDPPVIPVECAKCHSTFGYLDFLGADGSAAGTVNSEANIGTVIYCNVCHDDAAHAMDSVVFPSGDTVTGVGPEASCLQCHQGRQSTVSVDQALEGLPDDAVSEELGFINVHYYVAAATKLGSQTRGAYQYPGQSYAGFFEHAPGLENCHQCHDAHSLQIDADACSPCHLNVVDYADLFDIRSHKADYDGDGDVTEGVRGEIDALQNMLYAGIQDYAASVIDAPIVYSAQSFPYYMNDTNGNGEADDDEINFGNRYASWTPRLVRTAYNYHYVQKDPGTFAHNPAYVVQFLYDTLSDLSQVVPVDMAGLVRPAASANNN